MLKHTKPQPLSYQLRVVWLSHRGRPSGSSSQLRQCSALLLAEPPYTPSDIIPSHLSGCCVPGPLRWQTAAWMEQPRLMQIHWPPALRSSFLPVQHHEMPRLLRQPMRRPRCCCSHLHHLSMQQEQRLRPPYHQAPHCRLLRRSITVLLIPHQLPIPRSRDGRSRHQLPRRVPHCAGHQQQALLGAAQPCFHHLPHAPLMRAADAPSASGKR